MQEVDTPLNEFKSQINIAAIATHFGVPHLCKKMPNNL